MRSMSFVFVFAVTQFLLVDSQIMQHLCPMGGMLSNFNQDVDQPGAKCFYVAKFESITDDPFDEGNQFCLEYSKLNTKLAQPNAPMENEIMRYLLQENAGTTAKALIGIVMKSVIRHDYYKYNISFLNSSLHVVTDMYSEPYEHRYYETVGEVGAYTNEHYDYYLQMKNNLSNITRISGNELCTVMFAENGHWEVVRCREKENLGGLVICESPTFTKCKFTMSSCQMNKTLQACTMVAKDLDGNELQQEMCPLDVPILPLYCKCCEYTEWSIWTGCAGPCYDLRNVRFRIPLTDSSTCSDLVETVTCPRPDHCIGCEVGLWGNWVPCPKTCDDAVRYRTRTSKHIIEDKEWTQTMCDELAKDERTCDNLPCDQNCREKIGVWSACTTTCGFTGMQSRTIERIWNKTGNGLPCLNKLTVQNCPDNPCPIDCEYSDWIDGQCIPDCGKGTLTRQRSITEREKYGGTCTNETVRVVICVKQPCIVNCSLGEWFAWETCSVTCGVGVKKRKRTVIKQENEWGICHNDYDSQACHQAWACPVIDVTITHQADPKSLSSMAMIIYVITSVVAALVLVAVISGAIYCDKRLGKPTKAAADRTNVKIAMQEIFGPNHVIKEKQSEKESSKQLGTTYQSAKGSTISKTVLKKRWKETLSDIFSHQGSLHSTTRKTLSKKISKHANRQGAPPSTSRKAISKKV